MARRCTVWRLKGRFNEHRRTIDNPNNKSKPTTAAEHFLSSPRALLNTETEWNETEYTGINRNEPEWNGMDKNGTGTSRNDPGIYWNEPEWECNQHEYGQLNLNKAN